MDNRKPSSSTPRTETVSTGDRGAKGIVFWLIAALILVVAALMGWSGWGAGRNLLVQAG